MFFQFDCKQTCKNASDGDCGHSSDADTRSGIPYLGVVSCPNVYVRVSKGSHVLSDNLVTWDGANLKFESCNQIAEGITVLEWHKQIY